MAEETINLKPVARADNWVREVYSHWHARWYCLARAHKKALLMAVLLVGILSAGMALQQVLTLGL